MAFGIAGAIPFVVGGRRLLAQRPSIGTARSTQDPVVDQITAEMKRIHDSAKKNGVRGEHVHGFAGQVRVLLAHARATDMDADVRKATGRAIDARGRDAILDAPDADERVAAQLRAMGVDPADQPSRAPLDRDRRAAILDSMLVSGLTPHLERLDAALARAEKSADTFGADVIRGPHAMLAQDCWQSWGMLIDELGIIAQVFTMIGMPELAACMGIADILCTICMYVCCWGG